MAALEAHIRRSLEPNIERLKRIGITAGASAPEVLVQEIVEAFGERFALDIEIITGAEEEVFFPLPRPLRGSEAAE